MPDIGAYHPQIVHFVVASLFIGLPVHLLGFLKKPRFFKPMATVLLIVGTVAAFAAVRSGVDAHGPAERIPDTRDLVVHHEELGERTRTLFAVALLLELAGVALAWKAGGAGASVLSVESGEKGAAGASTIRFAGTALRGVVAVVWVVGAFTLFETATHGGELVYQYAGGVGFRTDDTEGDVGRLLRAGLYHQSRLDREAGRADDAARLVRELSVRFPESLEVRLLAVESLLQDRNDGQGALELLAEIEVPSDNPRMSLRKQLHAFDAYLLLNMPEQAAEALASVPEQYRESRTVVERRDRLGR
jgi:uncharacterized membrane protein